MQIVQTPTFKRQSKKLHKNQKASLDDAVRQILSNPDIGELKKGELKKGDLSSVRVHKFKMLEQLMLIAYEIFDERMELVLLALGSHENFYRNLKK